MINVDKSEEILDGAEVDVFVIGGGINGAAVARDAAGRGLRVMLSEKADYGAETSSASSKLIHGGLRYLEHFEFSLVRESLKERDIMLVTAPHLVHPLRFLIPVYQGPKRPVWMLRLGLFLYDLLSPRRHLERSGALTVSEYNVLPHLKKTNLSAVLHYQDCQVDDSRLVLAVLLDARARGAQIKNRQEVISIVSREHGYRVKIRDTDGTRQIDTRYVVNTAGPFANQVLEFSPPDLPRQKLRLVRGSHILIEMPEPAFETAFTLQHGDGRVIFVIPWLQKRYLMIGTTDTPQIGDPSHAECSDAERDYLLNAFNQYFSIGERQLSVDDIIWTWAGVRPLVDDGRSNPSKVTRDVKILHKAQGRGGFVTVYGGKLTTHRRLGEKVMKQLARMGCSMGGQWTESAPLYGGRKSTEELKQLVESGPKILDQQMRVRLVSTYGDVAAHLFETVRQDPGLASEVAPGVTQAELHHCRQREDAQNAEDFLYRRTKLFLELDTNGQKAIKRWFGG
ncbi:MAG: glycerol-3-phosphate dehydrogenase [Fimbriimonadaceae bacterium]|nr:glycerol-3-phosphate dehydrogenase [Alphaproteobacteria bacterium]